ncbi:hypothetical protein NVP1215B_059 [Vibrio phage 1.215.B._10N.222.54.F7]|nr:hypothetical protein NVP1215A_059 [Vibrio phage 1.215.A._10N.222.54.F7]AUR96082.1 hypothetical protein NVP1215B_059 [Vibrio phage 1.215.B._10N.222.54.F7]
MLNYQASQIVNAVKANIVAINNIAAHTENKKVENRLAVSNLNSTLGIIAAFDPSETEKTIHHLDDARTVLIGVFVREDLGLPPILAGELNKQIAYTAGLISALAIQLETLKQGA